MDAAASPMRDETLDDSPPARAGGREGLWTAEEREFARDRQDFLDALPVAAAVVCLDDKGEMFVDLSNERFRELAGPDGLDESGAKDVSFIAASGIAPRIRAFLNGEEQISQFDAADG